MDFVAKAGAHDLSGAPMNIVVIAIVLLAAIAILSVLPAIFAWHRRGPHVDTVPTVAVLWGIVAALFAVYDLLALKHGQDEYRMRLMTGYVESSDTIGAPALHVKVYAALAVWYLGMAIFSLRRGAAPPAAEPPQ